MTNDIQLANIQQSIGELRGDVKAILRQLEREREDAKDARIRVYSRIEKVEEDVRIVGATAAQARNEAQGINKTVMEEVKPQTDKLKNLGLKGGGFLAGAAMVGGFVAQPLLSAIVAATEKVFK